MRILESSGHSGWESDVILLCGHKPGGPRPVLF